ncbi:MAG: CHAT domain-containing tetratricopeptide repeat protein [Cyclobacteriaceae bacterium]
MSKLFTCFIGLVFSTTLCQAVFCQTDQTPEAKKPNEADIALQKAEDFRSLRQADSAEFYYLQAIEGYASNENFDDVVKAEASYSRLLSLLGRNEEVIDRLQDVRKKADSLGLKTSSILVIMLERLGVAYDKVGRHTKAYDYFVEFLRKSKSLKDTDTTYNEYINKTYNNLAVSLMRSGRFELANIYFDSALYELKRQNQENSELAHVIYLNKGNVNKELGYFHEAEIYYRKSMAMLDIPTIGSAGRGLAWWYFGNFYLLRNESADDIVKVIQYSDSAHFYFRDIPSLDLYCNYQYAEAYAKQGRYEEAIRQLKKAEAYILANYSPRYYELADVYTMLASIYLRQENTDLAIASLRKAIDFYEAYYPENLESRSLALIELGNCYARKNQRLSALDYYQQSIALLQKDFRPANILQNPSPDSLINSIALFEALKRKSIQYDQLYTASDSSEYLDAQLECYNLMIEEIDLGKQSMVELESKMIFNEKRYNVYEAAVSACYNAYERTKDSKYLEKAFGYCHASKANELAEKVRYANHRNIDGSRHNRLLLKITDLRLLIGNLKKDIAFTDDMTRKQHLKDDLFEAQNKLRSLSDSANHRLPGLFDNDALLVDLPLLKRSLNEEKALLLEYMQLDEHLIVFTLGKDQKAIKIPFGTAEKNLIATYKQSIESRKFDPTIAQQLYETLLSPALGNHNYRTLHIIPDGVLSILPFESLVTGTKDNGQNRFLIEDFVVSYNYSSLFAQNRLQKEKQYTYKFAGFSPDYAEQYTGSLALRGVLEQEALYSLPSAKAEVASISKILSGQHLDGPEASETNFKSIAGLSRYLHIAAHAISNPTSPMLSKVLFTENTGTKEDGITYAYEIYNMDLRAEMVVLSACNTGTGKYQKGEGLISLANSFMYAGSENLVTSLWSVPDQPTSVIMTDFYTYLDEGMTKANALRMARLNYLSNADKNTSEPYYWAGFILIGELEHEESPVKRWMVIALIAITLFAFLYYRFGKKVTPA